MSYVGAGLIILSSDGSHTLLVHDARSGKWGFPKGHRELVDKSDLETATRECYEETGLTPDDYAVHPEVFKISKGSQSYLFRYAVAKDGARIRVGPIHEIAAVAWLRIAALVDASNVLDGNKYLRTWIVDLQTCATKKSVNLYKGLLKRLLPLQETVSASYIVTRS